MFGLEIIRLFACDEIDKEGTTIIRKKESKKKIQLN